MPENVESLVRNEMLLTITSFVVSHAVNGLVILMYLTIVYANGIKIKEG